MITRIRELRRQSPFVPHVIRTVDGQRIAISAGRYLLSDVIEVGTSNTVLKGAGADKTTLVFTKSLQTLRPTSAVNGGGKTTTGWSWNGGLVWFKGSNPIGGVLAQVASPGAKRGEFSVPVTDVSKLSVGQEVAIEVKDDSSGTLVNYIFRDKPDDASELVSKQAYRYAARIREIKGNVVVLDRPLRFDLRTERRTPVCRPRDGGWPGLFSSGSKARCAGPIARAAGTMKQSAPPRSLRRICTLRS